MHELGVSVKHVIRRHWGLKLLYTIKPRSHSFLVQSMLHSVIPGLLFRGSVTRSLNSGSCTEKINELTAELAGA